MSSSVIFLNLGCDPDVIFLHIFLPLAYEQELRIFRHCVITYSSHSCLRVSESHSYYLLQYPLNKVVELLLFVYLFIYLFVFWLKKN